jgi:hypothetical protein
MLMAMAMTLALAVPAFATTLTSGDFKDPSTVDLERTLAAKTETPIIHVLVPAADTNTDKLILNPYALPVTQNTVISGGSATDTFKEQVISKALFIGSLSNVPLKVGMKVVATKGQDVVLATKSLAGDTKTTTKSVFLWGQVVAAGTGNTVPTTIPTFASEYDATAGKTGDMIQVGPSATDAAGVTRTGIYTIPAAENGNVNDAAKANWACAKFFGDAVQAPAEAWTSSDTVQLAVTFSFIASMNEP